VIDTDQSQTTQNPPVNACVSREWKCWRRFLYLYFLGFVSSTD